jgi:bacillithiol biosynthesis deacetylase BshB1
MGSRGTPEQRDEEAQKAAEIMGLDVRECLGLSDAHIEATVENRRRVVEVLRKYRPHIVITHNRFNRNPDHSHVSRLVVESCFTAGLVKYDTGQERHRPNKILYTMEYYVSEPSFVVDVTEQYERRKQAIACHFSQVYNTEAKGVSTYIASDRFAWEIESRLRYFGARIHADYGEGFVIDSMLEIDDLVAEVGLRGIIPGQGRK